MAPFPMDITLEEAILDFSGDKDNTLTRQSKRTDQPLDTSDNIPFFTPGGDTGVTSRSSSSSTISHSNSGVMSSPTHANSHHQTTRDIGQSERRSGNTPGGRSCGGILLSEISNCDVESTHLHVDSTDDDMLDSILKSLESHYGVQKQRSFSENSEPRSTATTQKSHVHSENSDTRLIKQRTNSETVSVSSVASDIMVSSHVDGDATCDGAVVDGVAVDGDVDSRRSSISNPDSDIETTPGSREEDGSETCEAREERERRDSGVGSSLTREPRYVTVVTGQKTWSLS